MLSLFGFMGYAVASTVAITASASLPAGTTASGIAVDPATGLVYVAYSGRDEVGVYDPALNLVDVIPTGSGVYRLAVDSRPGSHNLYVGLFPGAVSVYNLDSSAYDCTIYGLGAGISGLVVDEAGGRVFASIEFLPAVGVIDADAPCSTSPSVTYTGTKPLGLDYDEQSDSVYLAIHHEQKVQVFDPVGGGLTSIPVLSADPTDVGVDPVHQRAYVAYSQGNRISVIDTGAGNAVSHVTVGDAPRRLAVDPELDRAWVMILNFNQVVLLEGGVISQTLSTGQPDDLAVDPVSHCVYVSTRAPEAVLQICDQDADGDGYGPGDDCDDTDPTINPGAVEDAATCDDGVDQDCDGVDRSCTAVATSQLGGVVSSVGAAGLPAGTGNALSVKLNGALANIAAGDFAQARTDLQAALRFLAAQSGKKISASLAAAWTAEINTILSLLP